MSRRSAATSRVAGAQDKTRLEHVLRVGDAMLRMQGLRLKEPAIKIDATLQDVLNTGLSKNIIMMLVQALKPTEAARFFSIMSIQEVDMGGGNIRYDSGMLTTEFGSEQVARLIWNTAAVKFFGAPEGSIRSRDKFERVMLATTLQLPAMWNRLVYGVDHWHVNKLLVGVSICESLSKMIENDVLFYFEENGAWLVSLMHAISLPAETPHGRYVKFALKWQLAAAVGAHKTPVTPVHDGMSREIRYWLLNNLSASSQDAWKRLTNSLNSQVWSEGLDPFVAKIVQKTRREAYYRAEPLITTFEGAMNHAVNEETWTMFCKINSKAFFYTKNGGERGFLLTATSHV